MDLDIYKGSRFYEQGIFDIGLHQKPENKFLYLPGNSGHTKHIISNYVGGELKGASGLIQMKSFFGVKNKILQTFTE